MIADRDDSTAAPIAVVNRTLARSEFPHGGAVGRQILVDDNNTGPRPLTIVGVVDDLRETDLDGPVGFELFLAMKQVHPDVTSLVTATQFWAVPVDGDPREFGPSFVRGLHRVDPSVATAELTDLRSYVDATLAPRRFSVGLLVTFTLISLLLTMLGVYGIAAYTVEQRRREIGIRLALGATPRGVVALVLRRTLRLAAIGTIVGVFGALLTNGYLAGLMFGVSPGSPKLLALVSVLLLGTALVAGWLPGMRAARIDVMRSLSSD
jgi:hypothetical protein